MLSHTLGIFMSNLWYVEYLDIFFLPMSVIYESAKIWIPKMSIGNLKNFSLNFKWNDTYWKSHINSGIHFIMEWSQWCRPFISLLLQSLSKVTTKVIEFHSYPCWSLIDSLWSKATGIFSLFPCTSTSPTV